MPPLKAREYEEDGRKFREVTWGDGHKTIVEITPEVIQELDKAIEKNSEELAQKERGHERKVSGEGIDVRAAAKNLRMYEVTYGNRDRFGRALDIVFAINGLEEFPPTCITEIQLLIRDADKAGEIGPDDFDTISVQNRDYDVLRYSAKTFATILTNHPKYFQDMGLHWDRRRCPKCRNVITHIWRSTDPAKTYPVVSSKETTWAERWGKLEEVLEEIRGDRTDISGKLLADWMEQIGEVGRNMFPNDVMFFGEYGLQFRDKLKTISVTLQWASRAEVTGGWKYTRAYAVRTRCEAPFLGYGRAEIQEAELKADTRIREEAEDKILLAVKEDMERAGVVVTTATNLNRLILLKSGHQWRWGWRLIEKMKYRDRAGFHFVVEDQIFRLRK